MHGFIDPRETHVAHTSCKRSSKRACATSIVTQRMLSIVDLFYHIYIWIYEYCRVLKCVCHLYFKIYISYMGMQIIVVRVFNVSCLSAIYFFISFCLTFEPNYFYSIIKQKNKITLLYLSTLELNHSIPECGERRSVLSDWRT
jgi:hypothetical protein